MASEHDIEHDLEHDHDHSHAEELEHGHHEAELEADVEADARRRFALAQIRQYGDPALRLTAYEVSEFDDDLRRLVERMTQLMHDAQGVGLAATQVGVLRRIFVYAPDDESVLAVVNPTVTARGEETEAEPEGCLSLQGVKVPVDRPTQVTLAGKDEHGKDVSVELEGYGARVVQHELDHLNGVLIIDRTDDEHRKEALSTLRPRVALR